MSTITTAMTIGMVTGFFLGVAVSGSTRHRSFFHENARGPSGPPPLKLRRLHGYQPQPSSGTPNPPPRKP